MAKRLSYALVGCGLFAIVGCLIQLSLHRQVVGLSDFAGAGGGLALWIGERTGRVQSMEQLHRPITLFPEGVPGRR
jgi:hypothetical protein